MAGLLRFFSPAIKTGGMRSVIDTNRNKVGAGYAAAPVFGGRGVAVGRKFSGRAAGELGASQAIEGGPGGADQGQVATAKSQRIGAARISAARRIIANYRTGPDGGQDRLGRAGRSAHRAAWARPAAGRGGASPLRARGPAPYPGRAGQTGLRDVFGPLALPATLDGPAAGQRRGGNAEALHPGCGVRESVAASISAPDGGAGAVRGDAVRADCQGATCRQIAEPVTLGWGRG
jgi:hypothetical protein